jgi:hypothetical protein
LILFHIIHKKKFQFCRTLHKSSIRWDCPFHRFPEAAGNSMKKTVKNCQLQWLLETIQEY